jgi:hypothetical protein
MTLRLAIACCGILLFAIGCMINAGARLDDLVVANSPAGTIVDLALANGEGTIRGELLAARDTALVILDRGRITLVPYQRIGRATVAGWSPLFPAQRRLDSESLTRLRLLSRYPQDISDALMARLLAGAGQSPLTTGP